MPPVASRGWERERTTSPSGPGIDSAARFSASVLPVTVKQSPCSRPASSSIFITRGTPPTRSRSNIRYSPKGFRLATSGVRSLMRWKSSRSSSKPASCAIAGMCRTEFVDPPSAMISVMAFSIERGVMMSRAVMPWRIISMTARPESRASTSRRASTAGGDEEPGSDMPIASAALAMVLAVYIPPQVPAVGQTARSMRSRSSSDIRPRAFAPTASKAVTILTVSSRPSVKRT